METGLMNHQGPGEVFVHPLSNPGAAGICPEMLEVAEEANRAGDYDLAVEIYSSQLQDLPQPDRGLCLRKADSLARAGRISEALESYCTAAAISKLQPHELPLLVETIAKSLREKELGIPWTIHGQSNGGTGEDGGEGVFLALEVLDLFSCRLCRCLLHDPTTLECGHTFCKRCQDERSAQDCAQCKAKAPPGPSPQRRINVVLSGLLDKLFSTESRARRLWVEGELQWKNQNLKDALDKYNAAVELGKSNAGFALRSLPTYSSVCGFQAITAVPHCHSKAHYLKATALTQASRTDEALQEYFLCVALKPDWTKVKLEAQKVISTSAQTLLATLILCRLFYEPVTTPCGHTFCLKCLERCLDHNPNCPLCKENLSEYLANRGYNKTLLMEEVLQRYLGDELADRKKIHEEEMKELSNLNQEVPIFVCTMAFPTIPCPLHVFEPRYRLMIRRSMETGTKQFGMCIADDLKGFADYGCMLQVRDVKFFPDGRSVVDTIGVSRFKVLSHGQRDGYNTAKIEYLEDKKVEGDELLELLKLHDAVYEQANSWFTSLRDNMKSQILSHFGQLPTKDPDPQASSSGPAWCWWLLAVLPLENRAQLTILAMTSLKDRLMAIRRVLIFVTRKRPR
uniref:Uncharacterized protein n=1 Tax=Periophthalmus magnuspinnatus TaxID=409849 RepID=A0A3B4BDP6_9GOBI